MPTLDAMPGYNPSIVRRRPTDVGTIYGHSGGGVAPKDRVLSRPGWQGAFEGSSIDFAPGYMNDTLIVRVRDYVWRRARYLPPAQGSANHSWTADGPSRDMPTTRFNRNVRPIVGGAHQDMWGQHTNQDMRGNQLAGKAAMKPGRQNRLTVQRYRGQSYSQTTKIAGS